MILQKIPDQFFREHPHLSASHLTHPELQRDELGLISTLARRAEYQVVKLFEILFKLEKTYHLLNTYKYVQFSPVLGTTNKFEVSLTSQSLLSRCREYIYIHETVAERKTYIS